MEKLPSLAEAVPEFANYEQRPVFDRKLDSFPTSLEAGYAIASGTPIIRSHSFSIPPINGLLNSRQPDMASMAIPRFPNQILSDVVPPKKRRGNLPKHTTHLLRTWLNENLTHPYPTEEQKSSFSRQTGLTMNQVSNWFINARRRRVPATYRRSNSKKRSV